MGYRIQQAKQKALNFLLAQQHADGTWGPVGSNLYRITATSLALSCFNKSTSQNALKAISFLQKMIENPNTPAMTRLFAWPLLAFANIKKGVAVAENKAKEQLIALQSTEGGWGHAAEAYARTCGAEAMAGPALLPTFLSVLGLSHLLKKDDQSARMAIEKAVKWILSFDFNPASDIPPGEEKYYPIASAAFALAIFQLSESHAVHDDIKAKYANFLIKHISSSQVFEPEILPRAGRELNTPYIIFTPAWVLFALTLYRKPAYNKSICCLVKHLLQLQKDSGAVARHMSDPNEDIFVAAQFFLSLRQAEEYLKSPQFLDDVINNTELPRAGNYMASYRKSPVVLHISDVHFGSNVADADFFQEYESTYNSLKRDIEENYSKTLGLPPPNVLVVSGDITNKGKLQGYRVAADFLRALEQLLEIDDRENQIIIVPGNHDVNRFFSRLSYGVNPFEDVNDGDKNSGMIDYYNYRFTPFKDFFERFYGNRRFQLERNKMFQIYDMVASRHMVVIGFNSAEGTDHTEEGKNRGLLHLETIEEALYEIKRRNFPPNIIRLAVWHHALLTAAPNDPSHDDDVVRKLHNSGFCLLLHGHIHQARMHFSEIEINGAKFRKFGAGTVSVEAMDRPPEWPRHYQIYHFDIEKRAVNIFARQLIGKDWKAAPVFLRESSTMSFNFDVT